MVGVEWSLAITLTYVAEFVRYFTKMILFNCEIERYVMGTDPLLDLL